MSRLRGAAKLGAYLAVTVVLAVTHVASVSPLRLLRLRHRADRCSSALFRVWARSGASILGLHVEVVGRPPEPPFVLVSNHLGWVDVIVLASLLDCVFVSRADVRHWPFVGPIVRTVGTIFIDRESKRDIPRVLARIEQRLRHGRGIVIFPEGTSSRGDMVRPFKPALLETAVRAGLPVSCASLSYRTEPPDPPAGEVVCWWGDMPFWGHAVRLFRLSGARARVVFADRAVRDSDRKSLAVRAHAVILEQFEPVDGAWSESPKTDPARSSAWSVPASSREAGMRGTSRALRGREGS